MATTATSKSLACLGFISTSGGRPGINSRRAWFLAMNTYSEDRFVLMAVAELSPHLDAIACTLPATHEYVRSACFNPSEKRCHCEHPIAERAQRRCLGLLVQSPSGSNHVSSSTKALKYLLGSRGTGRIRSTPFRTEKPTPHTPTRDRFEAWRRLTPAHGHRMGTTRMESTPIRQ